MTPPILLFVAATSDAGKTTLIERLLPELASRGVRVAAVKLAHHVVETDTPGKDSHRLRNAGAHAVVLASPESTTLFLPAGRRDLPSLAALATAAVEVDLVIVEGGRDVPDLPRIEVRAPDCATGLGDDAPRVAIVGGVALPSDTAPRFERDDVAALADHVATWLAAEA